MKQKGYEAELKVVFEFDTNFVELVRTAALAHYSSDCHEAVNPGGFMWGAKNRAEWAAEKGELGESSFSSRQINLMMKMIELEDGPEYRAIGKVLREAFQKLRLIWEETNKFLENKN